MKVEKTLLSTNQKREQQQLQNRKSLLWTREKINQLIELYKKHECLWNHWHESYKSKEKRNRAIHDICTTLRVTKFEFGKKIHNLRNQFNTEMKKLEQRIEEAGVSLEEATTTSELRCKWSHFESLMFLRHVIEPRPAGYQSGFQASKKIRLKFDFNNTENGINILPLLSNNNSGCGSSSANTSNTEEQFPYDDNSTEEVITDDFQSFDNDSVDVTQPASRQEVYDQKYQPPQHTANQEPTATASRSFTNNSKKQKSSPACSSSSSQTEIINVNDDASILELNTSNLTVVPTHSLITTTAAATPFSPVISTPVIASVTSGSSLNRQTSASRDQWDAFGELVANEFRNLNSELSRKRLKRKIMQAMLEIGEEDDTLTAKCTRNN